MLLSATHATSLVASIWIMCWTAANLNYLGLSRRNLLTLKDSYFCGDACPVNHFETKCILRCSDFIEMQYFTYAKGNNKFEVDSCCYCCCLENLLSIDKMKEEFNCGGQQPLQLCRACCDLRIKPPMTNANTSFVERSNQKKVAKKRSKSQIRDLVSISNKRKK